jgi:hypothetical protein
MPVMLCLTMPCLVQLMEAGLRVRTGLEELPFRLREWKHGQGVASLDAGLWTWSATVFKYLP